MPKDKVIFYTKTKEEQKRFDYLRNKLFKSFESILEDFEEDVWEVNDPDEQYSETEIEFRRAIAIDHLVMDIMKILGKKI